MEAASEPLSVSLTTFPDIKGAVDALVSQLRTCVADTFTNVLDGAISYATRHGDALLSEEDAKLSVLNFIRQMRDADRLRKFVDPAESDRADLSAEWRDPDDDRNCNCYGGYDEYDSANSYDSDNVGSDEDMDCDVDSDEASCSSDELDAAGVDDTFYIYDPEGFDDPAEPAHKHGTLTAVMAEASRAATAASDAANAAVVAAMAAMDALNAAKPSVAVKYTAVCNATNVAAKLACTVATALATYAADAARAADDVATAVESASTDADTDLLILLDTPAAWLPLLGDATITALLAAEIAVDADKHTTFYKELIETLKPTMKGYAAAIKGHGVKSKLSEVRNLSSILEVWECACCVGACFVVLLLLLLVLHNQEENPGAGFNPVITIDSVVVLMPLLNFVYWHAALAARGDGRR
jgi:hypothetical protein